MKWIKKSLCFNVVLFKGERLHDFNVGVTSLDPTVAPPSPSTYSLCAAFVGVAGPTVNITCNTGIVGRYVVIQIPGSGQMLTLCEVEVFTSSNAGLAAAAAAANGTQPLGSAQASQ